jgi:type VI secretion system secreted protein VgrG
MKYPLLLSSLTVALGVLFSPSEVAATSMLGAAQGFAVLGATTVTSTGPTTISGNLGVSSGSSITGFPPGNVAGTIYSAGGVMNQAHNGALAAYNTVKSRSFTTDLTGLDLGGRSLTPGTYYFASSAELTGALTLDFLSNPDADFFFQIGSTLTTASNSAVKVINGGSQSGVYWQVGSSATLGTDTLFAGNILANQSITLTTGADISGGRAIALNGAVTLDSNEIRNAYLDDFGSYGYSGGSQEPVPEPATMLLFGSGLAGLSILGKTLRKAEAKVSI